MRSTATPADSNGSSAAVAERVLGMGVVRARVRAVSRSHDRRIVLGRLRSAPHGQPVWHLPPQRSSERERAIPRRQQLSNGGLLGSQDGVDYAGELSAGRNTLRVAPYSRLDARANRTFTWDRKRLTLFLEAINVYNRTNVRAALPSVNRRTFEATGLFEPMVPLIPSSASCWSSEKVKSEKLEVKS
jgi:TonB dependent receptor.